MGHVDGRRRKHSNQSMATGFLSGTALRAAGLRRRSAAAPTTCAAKSQAIEVNTPAQKKLAVLRETRAPKSSPKILSRVEQLRLLSRLEASGALGVGASRPCSPTVQEAAAAAHSPLAAERAGLSLSSIESLGLLSKAESLGALSIATDVSTPGKLSLAGLALLAAAVAVVVLPGENSGLLAAQAVGALLLGGGGLASLGGASLLGSLQKV